ncbi:MAG: hypothetical protein HY730_06505 [Candidatus Tectomicrobia bacterium]|uniref:Uncharacterized protein n=1 Tax=Tectimicrobiota bacterium TaxID=2528274 RepID=A0A933GNJ0_UNCTE|nr:hypothetical protein [Candidatus Tectomicrobia bacterium]
MEIIFTEHFDSAYETLTSAEKNLVWKAIELLGNNPRHPGLHTKKMEVKKDIWECRPSGRLRITFEMTGGSIILRNVGEHDKVLKRP